MRYASPEKMALWAIRDKSYSLSTRVIFHEKNEEHIFDEKLVIFLVQSAETRSIKGDGAWLQNHGQSDLILNNKLTSSQ